MDKEKEVSLEINGQIKLAKQGSMIIEATDSVREYVPRFCYHKELSIAANCRMCLVCLLYTSPSPRDLSTSRMPSSA